MRHIRFPFASVATEQPPQQPLFGPAPEPLAREPRPTPITHWARNSHPCRQGRCVAIRAVGEDLLVGVKLLESLTWYPLNQVLGRTEAQVWFARAQF